MKKCPVCGVMMGDNIARCSMCKYDFQKASGGDASAAVAEAQKVLNQKEEESIARTEAKRSEEEKHLAEIREKINREIETLTAKFESEKLKLDSEYAAMQKQAIDEKLRLENELNETRIQVEAERNKIREASAEGERIKQAKIDEGQAKHDEMIKAAEIEQQRMIEETQKEIQEAAAKIDAEYAEVLQKRNQLVEEAEEAQAYLNNVDSVRKELEAAQAEQDQILAQKKQEIANTESELTKIQADFEAEKERLEKEGRAIAEQQAGEALAKKEAAEAELAKITEEKDAIIAEAAHQKEKAEGELETIRTQAQQIISEAEEAAAQRDEIIKEINDKQEATEREISEKIAAADKELADKTEEANKIVALAGEKEAALAQYEQQLNDCQESLESMNNQIESIKAEYEQAQVVIADSKNITVTAQAEAEEIVLMAEKRAVFLKEAALSESLKGQLLNEIADKEKKIEEMEKQRDELMSKIEALEASMEALQQKVASGAFGGGDAGPKEYSVEVVNHNDSSEVDAKGIDSVLKAKSAEGWKLVQIINDDGGKLQSSLGDNSGGSGSLAIGAFASASKEDRVVLIFERSRK